MRWEESDALGGIQDKDDDMGYMIVMHEVGYRRVMHEVGPRRRMHEV